VTTRRDWLARLVQTTPWTSSNAEILSMLSIAAQTSSEVCEADALGRLTNGQWSDDLARSRSRGRSSSPIRTLSDL
jgi:hypothetical protein